MAELDFIAWDEIRDWEGDMLVIDSLADGYLVELKTAKDERFSATAMMAMAAKCELADAPKAGYDYQKHNKVRRKR